MSPDFHANCQRVVGKLAFMIRAVLALTVIVFSVAWWLP
jgi:hypothetical protein